MNIRSLLALADEMQCKVLYDEPLARYTSFKIGGRCTAMVDINSPDALAQLAHEADYLGVRTMALGNGTNVLFDDRGFDGVIFLIGNSMDKIYMKNETTVTAQAGCSLLKLCRFALEHSLSGLEFAYGIPGTVGGAVYMNAGAYGGETKDVVKLVRAVSPEGRQLEIDAGKLDMSYRHSRFCGSRELIVEAEFELVPGEHDTIQDKMVDLMSRRREKQPLNYPSAGSTFKRPEGQFAGQLIEQSGLKGFSVGGAQVSEKHCGFVVNKGGATCGDVLGLIREVQERVREKTGFFLECEVKYIPYKE
ncbi:MAG: UDP-N-acetylmuramate dehydrogenase [Ruminococcus sp.]|nr:UDP-N-acetylmuramate dehydrogenase [Ruminococcus sp.]